MYSYIQYLLLYLVSIFNIFNASCTYIQLAISHTRNPPQFKRINDQVNFFEHLS